MDLRDHTGSNFAFGSRVRVYKAVRSGCPRRRICNRERVRQRRSEIKSDCPVGEHKSHANRDGLADGDAVADRDSSADTDGHAHTNADAESNARAPIAGAPER